MRFLLLISLVVLAIFKPAIAADYDLAINNGRVIDPETGLDAVRHIGVTDGKIAKISKRPLKAESVIDATGLVVAPGFIDRNSYTLGPELFRLRASDGVTTTFNFEEGAADVAAAYGAHEGKALINFGFSASEGAARATIAAKKPLTVTDGILISDVGLTAEEAEAISNYSLGDGELETLLAKVEEGLKAGAPAIGIGPYYFPKSTNREVLAIFKLAAKYNRSVQIHARDWNSLTDHSEMYEIYAGALSSGASIQISHLNSVSADYIDIYAGFLDKAHAAGLPVTSECYPYTAGMNSIQSPGYDSWREWPEERFERYQWAKTGERLTKESFGKYREEGGFVIIHWMQEEWIEKCVAHPLTQIASDGGWDGGDTHPRVAGSNTRVLGRYVREKKLLSLNDAIRKMALMPAQSLENIAPQMAKKGRLQKNMDADIVVFDPETVMDRATYAEPVLEPIGVMAVIVNGVVVKQDGALIDGVNPGKAIRLDVIE